MQQLSLAQLIPQIRGFMAEHPAESGEILRAVADGISDYEKAQDELRGKLSDHAILCLMAIQDKIPKKALFPLILDVCYTHFPKGVMQHAECEVNFWNTFLERAKVYPMDLEWLLDTRGEKVLAWWVTQVVPRIT